MEQTKKMLDKREKLPSVNAQGGAFIVVIFFKLYSVAFLLDRNMNIVALVQKTRKSIQM